MYKYADSQGWCDKDYSQYVKIKRDDDDEHGVPFSDTDLENLGGINKARRNCRDASHHVAIPDGRISEYISLK